MMVIAGNEFQFRKIYRSKWKWPKQKFSDRGPKLSLAQVCGLDFEVLPEHAAMLLWQNGGEPDNRWLVVKDQVHEIDRFLGVGTEFDIKHYMFSFRHQLPRYSVPLALVSNWLGDLSFLLTFPIDYADLGREKKIWYYTWYHEQMPQTPDDIDNLTPVADTIAKLIGKLKPEPPPGYDDDE